jgi:hypothetical protein
MPLSTEQRGWPPSPPRRDWGDAITTSTAGVSNRARLGMTGDDGGGSTAIKFN